MAKATRRTTSRRQLIQAGGLSVLGALAGAPPASAAAVPVLTAQPSARGRKLLQLVATYPRIWASPPDEAVDPDAFARHQERGVELHAELQDTAREISARPVRSLADVMDRIIIATYCAEFAAGHDTHSAEIAIPALAGVLALAGLTPGECCMGDNEGMDQLAA